MVLTKLLNMTEKSTMLSCLVMAQKFGTVKTNTSKKKIEKSQKNLF